VLNHIDFVKSKGQIEGVKNVLDMGASTGLGLASRITSSFGSNASTTGVFFEKPPQDSKTASPGWYNSAAFHEQAKKSGPYAKSITVTHFLLK
jgi:enoyl-[acyl-carrier protein] reductase/trans-2-enoyl-CoA reductase (NAD+)